MTLRLLAPGFVAKLAVYRGNSVGGLTLVATGSFGQLPGEVTVSFPNLKDAEYVIAVDGAGGAQGSFSLRAAHQAGPGPDPPPSPASCDACFISFEIPSPVTHCGPFAFDFPARFSIVNQGMQDAYFRWSVTGSAAEDGGGQGVPWGELQFMADGQGETGVLGPGGRAVGPTAFYAWAFTGNFAPPGAPSSRASLTVTAINLSTNTSCHATLEFIVYPSGQAASCNQLADQTPVPSPTFTPEPTAGGAACLPSPTPSPSPTPTPTPINCFGTSQESKRVSIGTGSGGNQCTDEFRCVPDCVAVFSKDVDDCGNTIQVRCSGRLIVVEHIPPALAGEEPREPIRIADCVYDDGLNTGFILKSTDEFGRSRFQEVHWLNADPSPLGSMICGRLDEGTFAKYDWRYFSYVIESEQSPPPQALESEEGLPSFDPLTWGMGDASFDDPILDSCVLPSGGSCFILPGDPDCDIP